MSKSITLNLRVNPEAKQNAEAVLKQLGIPMSTAIDMYLKQISLTQGIPFPVSLPKAPSSINMDLMSEEELKQAVMLGCQDAEAGRLMDAKQAFASFREKHI